MHPPEGGTIFKYIVLFSSNMINDKLIELHKELDRTILEADQSRGLYLGLTFDDYQILKTKESEISRSSKIKKAS